MNRELRGKEDWNIVGCLEKLSEKLFRNCSASFRESVFPTSISFSLSGYIAGQFFFITYTEVELDDGETIRESVHILEN